MIYKVLDIPSYSYFFVTGDFENEDEITDYVKCKIESLRAESEHKEDEDEGNLHTSLYHPRLIGFSSYNTMK